MNAVVRNCPVCVTHEVKPIFNNKMIEIGGLDMSYILSRCNLCGFTFASELPLEAQYQKYYSTLSKYDSQPSVSALDQFRIYSAVSFLDRNEIPKDANIIDIGCGFGAFLEGLSRGGWLRLQGVDPAPKSATTAREQFGLSGVVQGGVRDAKKIFDLGQADLVCLMAVIEHLPELRRDLAEILSVLQPSAKVLIEVPAMDIFSLDNGEPYGEISIEHIQFFSSHSLRNLLGSFGATVISEQLLPIPSLYSGTLLVLARVGGVSRSPIPEDPRRMDRYLAGSARRWANALMKVPEKPFVLYGAGSHSARLLPSLSDSQRLNIQAVVDGNVNLQGKSFGDLTIQPPEALRNYPGLPVLVSSFRSETAIASSLSQRFPGNPICLMYH